MSLATMPSCAEQLGQALRNEWLSVGMLQENPTEVDLDFFLSGIPDSPLHEVEDACEAQYEELRGEYNLPSAFHEALLKLMAVQIVRMNGCRKSESLRLRQVRLRAKTAWEIDRKIEANAIGAKLPRNPRRWRDELLATLYGTRWLVDGWRGLLRILKGGRVWNDRQRAMAFNLMGVPVDARESSNLLPKDQNPEELIRLVEQEIKHLESRLPNLELSDKFDRRVAESGTTLSFDRESVAIRRYEAGCRRQFELLVKILSPYHSVNPSPPPRTPQTTEQPILKNNAATSALKTNPSLANAIETERYSILKQELDRLISAPQPAAPAPKPVAPAPAPAASRPAEPPKFSGNRKQRRRAEALARKRG